MKIRDSRFEIQIGSKIPNAPSDKGNGRCTLDVCGILTGPAIVGWIMIGLGIVKTHYVIFWKHFSKGLHILTRNATYISTPVGRNRNRISSVHWKAYKDCLDSLCTVLHETVCVNGLEYHCCECWSPLFQKSHGERYLDVNFEPTAISAESQYPTFGKSNCPFVIKIHRGAG